MPPFPASRGWRVVSKYDPLQRHLEHISDAMWHTTFAEIERILGFSLPPSARSHQAWWANSNDHMPQHRAWLDVGWRTIDLNLSAGNVAFQRTASWQPRTVASSTKTKSASLESALLDWDSSDRTLVCGLGMTWRPLGQVRRDTSGRLTLPKPPAQPGIYCFRVRHDGTERRYIGETDNLARRFNNYRTPGGTQPTNVRINAILLEALCSGAEVSASAVIDGAWVNWGTAPVKADLSNRSARCLFENAAIIESGALEIETLNRAGTKAADS